MATLHRKDMGSGDFVVLANFVKGLNKVKGYGTPIYDLGKFELWLPHWTHSDHGWQVQSYKPHISEAIGIPGNSFRSICRYLNCSKSSLIEMLFSFSMISVSPDMNSTSGLRFRQKFEGTIIDSDISLQSSADGYVIEKRRAVGGFR